MDILIWLVAALTLFIGCWVQTALGFGMAVIGAPIIILVKPEWVPVVLTAIAWLLSLFNVHDLYKDIELHQLKLAFITRIPGTLIGAWLLTVISLFWLQVFVALSVIFAVIVSYYGKQFSYTAPRLGAAAFVSGITGTTTSIGGPPMALVMQHGKPTNIRANLALYFAYSCSLSLISYAYIGILTMELVWHSISFAPFCIAGFYFGKKSRNFVDAGGFRSLLLWLCGIAGIFALIAAFY